MLLPPLPPVPLSPPEALGLFLAQTRSSGISEEVRGGGSKSSQRCLSRAAGPEDSCHPHSKANSQPQSCSLCIVSSLFPLASTSVQGG